MSRRVVSLGLAVLLLHCSSASAGPDACPAADAAFDAILRDSSARNGVHGSQAAVLIPGRHAWHGVYGRNGVQDPMRPDLMIGTGSISKMYTVVAALRLVDQGVIALDDTLGRWFPNTPNVHPSIPLRLVMQQTSGLADYSAAPNYSATILADPDRYWQPDELLAFIGPPLFAPGTGWNASNTNRLLLGIIVARESGVSVGTFMQRELWPGHTQSWVAGDGPAPGPLATQWASNAAGVLYDFSALYFGPALFSSRIEVQASAGDIADFAQRTFAGTLLTPGTRAEMLRIVPDDGGIAGQTGGGLGIRRYDYLGRTLYGHSGATGNATALVLYDPATGAVAAVSVNQGGSSHANSHFRTTPALLQAAIACAES
jgi:D-alanyl-D-alanine carboxypeptidase